MEGECKKEVIPGCHQATCKRESIQLLADFIGIEECNYDGPLPSTQGKIIHYTVKIDMLGNKGEI